jgi:hypothetical protein
MTLICTSCDEVVEDEADWVDFNGVGYCNDCFENGASDGSGTKYCCGVIYEDGEDHCMSCGDPL